MNTRLRDEEIDEKMRMRGLLPKFRYDKRKGDGRQGWLSSVNSFDRDLRRGYDYVRQVMPWAQFFFHLGSSFQLGKNG